MADSARIALGDKPMSICLGVPDGKVHFRCEYHYSTGGDAARMKRKNDPESSTYLSQLPDCDQPHHTPATMHLS